MATTNGQHDLLRRWRVGAFARWTWYGLEAASLTSTPRASRRASLDRHKRHAKAVGVTPKHEMRHAGVTPNVTRRDASRDASCDASGGSVMRITHTRCG